MKPHISHKSKQKPPKTVFLAATIVIFFSALSVADSVGLVPYYIDGSEPARTETLALSNLPELGEPVMLPAPAPEAVLPTQITIDAINLDLTVQNPETRDIATLDEFLKKGPVRYVDSARLGEKGNVLIFAHTSHLPVVKNQMYKAFNKVSDLKAGDSITLKGEDGKSYLYNVVSVEKVDASDTIIDFSPVQGAKLTLVTCDTLASKSARFVVTADFVGTL